MYLDDEDISYIRQAEAKPVDSAVVSSIEQRERRRILLFGLALDAFWEAQRQGNQYRKLENLTKQRWIRGIRFILRKNRVAKTINFLDELAKPKPKSEVDNIPSGVSNKPSLAALEPISSSIPKSDSVLDALASVEDKLKRGTSHSKLDPIEGRVSAVISRRPSNERLDNVGVRRSSFENGNASVVGNGRSAKADLPKVNDSTSSKSIRRRSLDSVSNTPSSKNPNRKTPAPISAASSAIPVDHIQQAEAMMQAVAGAALSVLEHAMDGIVKKTGSMLHASKPAPLQPISAKGSTVSEKRRRSLDSDVVAGSRRPSVSANITGPTRGSSAKKGNMRNGQGSTATGESEKVGASTENAVPVPIEEFRFLEIGEEENTNKMVDIPCDVANTNVNPTLNTSVAVEGTNEEKPSDNSPLPGDDRLGEIHEFSAKTPTTIKRMSSVEVPDSLLALSSLA